MNLKRVSPILERETETELLNLAPEPWKILKCLETDIVFLENPPGYEALKEEFPFIEEAAHITYTGSQVLAKGDNRFADREWSMATSDFFKIWDILKHDIS